MNNKKSRLSCAIKTGILTLSIFSATQAHAIQAPNFDYPIIDEVFITADADRNGQLSVDEFYQLHSAASLIEFEMTFKVMDRDGSADLNSKEFISFLPTKAFDVAAEQFANAAGEDELMDVKEFTLMRIKEQGANTDLLWKFALMDQNHDGELSPEEFYGLPVIQPPVIIDPPVTIKPPVIIDPPLPPEVIVDPVDPQEPNDPVKPEAPAKPSTVDQSESIESDIVGPVKPDSKVLDEITRLTRSLENLENRMERIQKSISRILEKMDTATDANWISRMERRLARQKERMEETAAQHQETLILIKEAKQLLEI